MEKNYDSIDVMKFIAAIFIIGIHTSALRDVSPILNDVIFQGIGRLGFPLFFTASGYLLSRKIRYSSENQDIIVKKYIKKIVFVCLFWILFNWKWVWESWFTNSSGSLMNDFYKLLLDLIFQSTYSGLWYLTSCIISAYLYYIVMKKISRNQKLFITGIIFIAVAIFFLKINNPIILFMKTKLFIPINIFMGPIYFSIGDFIANDNVENIKENQIIYILGTLIAIILWLVEIYMTRNILVSTDQLFIYPILTYFIFSLLLIVDKNIPHSYEMRKMSNVMYLSQFSFIFLNSVFFNVPSTFMFLITVIETIVLGIFVLQLNKIKEFSWLNLAY